jgi:hypothetical protein
MISGQIVAFTTPPAAGALSGMQLHSADLGRRGMAMRGGRTHQAIKFP